MPLISRGSFESLRAAATGPAADEFGLTEPQPFTVIREVTRALQPVPVRLAADDRPRGVTLERLRLTPGSRVMLRRVADPELPLHVLAWSWDLSGEPPLVTPAAEAEIKDWAVPVSEGARLLGGAGLPLVPPRRAVGVQSVRVIVWQSDRGADPAGVTGDIREAMRHSKLASVLDALAGGARTTMMSVVGVREAAGELGREIAPVLRALVSDYVDLFEGFYPVAAHDQNAGDADGTEGAEGADGAEEFATYHTEVRVRREVAEAGS